MPACRYLLLMAFCLPVPARADIYQYFDDSGTRVLSNAPHQGAVRLDLPPLPVLSRRPVPVTVPMAARPHSRATHAAAQGTAPVHISSAAQQVRESQRRKILVSELSQEEQRLQDTQRRLARRPGNPQETAQLRDQLTLHQKNIAALRQELASAR